jgi:hypothetical protein
LYWFKFDGILLETTIIISFVSQIGPKSKCIYSSRNGKPIWKMNDDNEK